MNFGRILILGAAAASLTACITGGGGGLQPRRVFATSQSYTGAIGGVAAADSICNTLAAAAILGGTWRAFLSTDTVSATAHIQELGPWFRVNRKLKVFNNRVGFTVGALNAITDEYGQAIPSGVRVWTGTRADGRVDGTQHCSDWTSNSGYGTVGNPNALLSGGPQWMISGEGTYSCASVQRLYCFEQ